MIHRALFGSIERFFGILLEHYAGAFPAWLAPVQARVLPVARRPPGLRRDGRRPACGPRASGSTWSPADEPLGARIRQAKLEKLPVRPGRRATTTSPPARSASTRRDSERPERGVPVDGVHRPAGGPRSTTHLRAVDLT